jgi:YggT family protein
MSADYWIQPIVFLIETLVGLYILALLLRFLLQWSDADYHNPISQFLIKVTHPPLRFFRRFIPPIGRIDTASLVLIFGLRMLATGSVLLLQSAPTNFAALTALTLVELVGLVLDFYFFGILIRTILSWVSPDTYNPASAVLYSLTEPLLRASRRVLPPMGGIDLSPLLPLIGIQLTKMLLIPPLQQLVSALS